MQTNIRQLSIEIYSDLDRKREACILAANVEMIQLWNDRLWLAFQEVSDYLNAPHVPLLVFPLDSPRQQGMIQRANFWLTPHSLPTPPFPAILVDTKIMQEYLPNALVFETFESFKKLGNPDILDKWTYEKGLRIVGAYSDMPSEDEEFQDGLVLPNAEIALPDGVTLPEGGELSNVEDTAGQAEGARA